MVVSRILGADGRPMERKALLEEQAGPTVTGVRSILSGHPSEGLTPARLGAILRQAEEGDATAYLELAEDIEEKFVHYRSVLSTRRWAVSQLEVTIEAATDDAAGIAHADYVREALAPLDMADVVFDLLDGLGKGYAVSEIIWDMSGRDWWPQAIVWRDPRWFQLDRTDGTTLRLRDLASVDGVNLAPYKFIQHRPTTKSGLPIRAGLARPAAWLHLFQSFGWKDWLSFVEVYGHPVRLGKYGPGASEPDKEKLLRAVRSISTDFAAIIPEGMLIEFPAGMATAANADIYDRLLARVEQTASKLVLGQTATTDAIAGGHAVGQEHREVQQDLKRADARQMSATLTRDLARPLIDLRFGPQKQYPRAVVGIPDAWDATTMMPVVKQYVEMGGRVASSVIRDKLGLPDPAEGEELLGSATLAPPVSPMPGAARKSLAAAKPGANTPGANAIDELTDELLADWEPALRPAADQILALASASADGEEFWRRMLALAGSMGLEELQEALTSASFVARLAGRLGAVE